MQVERLDGRAYDAATDGPIVRLDVAQLDEEMVTLLRRYLDSDERIRQVAVEIPKLDVVAREAAAASDESQALTIRASAEPLVLIVQLLQAHAGTITETAKAAAEGAAGAAGAAATGYLVKKLKEWKKQLFTHGDDIEIVDPAGNVIRIVKGPRHRK